MLRAPSASLCGRFWSLQQWRAQPQRDAALPCIPGYLRQVATPRSAQGHASSLPCMPCTSTPRPTGQQKWFAHGLPSHANRSDVTMRSRCSQRRRRSASPAQRSPPPPLCRLPACTRTAPAQQQTAASRTSLRRGQWARAWARAVWGSTERAEPTQHRYMFTCVPAALCNPALLCRPRFWPGGSHPPRLSTPALLSTCPYLR